MLYNCCIIFFLPKMMSLVSFILFNIFDFRPFFKKPTILIVIVGDITSFLLLNTN